MIHHLILPGRLLLPLLLLLLLSLRCVLPCVILTSLISHRLPLLLLHQPPLRLLLLLLRHPQRLQQAKLEVRRTCSP